MTWLSTAKKRVLELPEIYLDQCVAAHTATWKADRRESELDDHGETYPMAWQGPDLYVYLHIPPGAYTLSLYFFNKDGHSGMNRDRDYAITMIPLPASYHFGTALQPNTATLAKMRGTAQSRVLDFWGGVWKRFLVRGPMKLAIRVAKNYSLNTILQAAMLDPLAEYPAPYYYGHRAWQAREKQRHKFRTRFVAAWRTGQLSGDPSAGRALWHRHPTSGLGPQAGRANSAGLAVDARILQIMDVLEHHDPLAWAANQQLVYLSVLRWCAARYEAIPKNPQAVKIAERCYYHVSLFHRWEAVEKSQGILAARAIEKGLRWDQIRSTYHGMEFNAIKRYVRRQRAGERRGDRAQPSLR